MYECIWKTQIHVSKSNVIKILTFVSAVRFLMIKYLIIPNLFLLLHRQIVET
jgi:hypothetical protein